MGSWLIIFSDAIHCPLCQKNMEEEAKKYYMDTRFVTTRLTFVCDDHLITKGERRHMAVHMSYMHYILYDYVNNCDYHHHIIVYVPNKKLTK